VVLHPHGLASAPYVAVIAVAPEFRSRGIGAKLLRFAEIRFRDRRDLFLCVSSFNLAAQRLYARLGFEKTCELKDFGLDGNTEYLLRKRL
jgi:ribosomal-protein-alanine N-acetyltransferase